MNYSGIDWEIDAVIMLVGNLFDATQDAFLLQHVDFPIHDGKTIDLQVSTNDIHVQSVEDVGNLGKSHHLILLVKVMTNP